MVEDVKVQQIGKNPKSQNQRTSEIENLESGNPSLLWAPGTGFVEVRDSRTGYFIPPRSGVGVWSDGRIRRRHLEIQVDIQTRKLYLEFYIWIWGRGESYLEMEIGVLHRNSIRIS